MDQLDHPVIMVVEDDPDLLMMMSMTLEQDGYQVDARLAPPNWLELEQVHPDLIFLDVDLAPYSGTLVCKSIKENLVNWQLPVVLTSGHPRSQLEQKAHYCHADAILTKPFYSQALKRLAERYAYGKRPDNGGC